ncbi:uncharacterized protein [Procambarus clarkii]|uniref:uncharacterized protein n=1 Tax=Procambarus clarkii TaxID=6728 RepID=UPI001E675AF4|nr:CCR4-NOT transcription complex subunit 3-like [Procambarus clarkii]XP_045583074.1 CCR4-NOT transcription complex subunit 3-like [Procambarus clarkii]XP_045583075.1 CCR4-NOT transcription complex subunit 3-like [Procambarus clarkii]
MQETSHFLKAALQVGPWRITRRVMLFVIVFCVVIIVFGTFILKTHRFDDDHDWDDDDDDDDDDDKKTFSSGDSVMLVMIGLSGMAGLVTLGSCFMATSNSPRQLGSDSNSPTSSVYTVSGGAVPPVRPHQQLSPRPSAPESDQEPYAATHGSNNNNIKMPLPQHTNGYPQNPSYPRNPHYPPDPPPSYSAASYPVGGARVVGRAVPHTALRVVSCPPTLSTIADLPPPTLSTIADLPPPYSATPAHSPTRR